MRTRGALAAVAVGSLAIGLIPSTADAFTEPSGSDHVHQLSRRSSGLIERVGARI